MNELLQKHGCSNVFSVPEGLKELMSDITREVLREQPKQIFDFIANYLSVLLITREHGILSLKILDDLCDCKPSVSEHLMQLGLERREADMLAQVIKEEIVGFEPIEGKEKIKEMQIMKKILTRSVLDEDMAAKVCQIARNAYRDYWYRKKLLEKSMQVQPEEPWEIAAQHTLELYKKTKPSFSELVRATETIQAAYRGYHIRKNLLGHLKPKKKMGPKVDLLGPPIDIAESREIDLGPVIDIKVKEDDVNTMFDEYGGEKIGLGYDPMKTITHVDDEEFLEQQPMGDKASRTASQFAGMPSTKSITGSQFTKSKMSRFEDVPESRTSRVDATSRQSRLSSQISEGHRASRLPSQLPMSATDLEPASSLHKISFLERPPEVINEFLPEDEGEAADEGEQEVLEEPGIEPAEAVEGEAAQEVPEDIPDDHTEGDGEESAPTASVPSTAPESAGNTDVEDAGGDTTGEDEEEG